MSTKKSENKIEFGVHVADWKFLMQLLEKTHLGHLINEIKKAKTSPECEEYVVFELSSGDANEIAGQLAFEANHCRSKKKAARIDEIFYYFDI